MSYKGYKASEETRQKQRDSARKKPAVSEETRARMAEGQKRRRVELRANEFCAKNDVPFERYLQEIAAGNVWCTKCLQFKPAAESCRKSICLECLYAKNEAWYRRNRDAVQLRMRQRYADNTNGAKDKNKAWSLKKYGATLEWYKQKLEEQGGGCAICGSENPNEGNKYFSVDHNHSCCTERKHACDKCRRGLLCTKCNHALERMETVDQWYYLALQYLAKYGGSLIGA